MKCGCETVREYFKISYSSEHESLAVLWNITGLPSLPGVWLNTEGNNAAANICILLFLTSLFVSFSFTFTCFLSISLSLSFPPVFGWTERETAHLPISFPPRIINYIFWSRSSSVALHHYGSLKCSSQLNQERLIIASHNLHNCLFVIWVTSVNICFVTFMIYINIAIYEIKIISPVINMMMIIIVILNIMIMIIIYLLLLIIIIIILVIIIVWCRNCVAMAKDSRSTFPIMDENGCPVDPTIFPR